MKFGRRVKYSQLLIPTHPVRGKCAPCGTERGFRMLVHCELTHFLWLLQWDFEYKVFRVCTSCGMAYAMSTPEVKAVLPLYQPPVAKYRRRLVQAVIWGPIVGYLVYYYLQKL